MDRGLGQEQAARVLGIGKTTIVNWEMGHAEGVALWHLPSGVVYLHFIG